MTDLRLLMIAPAPVIQTGAQVTLDAKFVTGMRLQAALWPGTCDCLLRAGTTEIPFGARAVDPAREPFGLTVVARDETITPAHLDGYDLILCSADDDRNLTLDRIARAAGVPLVATLEYTLETRLQILRLDRNRGALRRLASAVRMRLREVTRRRLLRHAAGLQANGYPAHATCRAYDPHALLYLDNRMTGPLFADAADQSDRRARLLSGAPLRLVYSGRLEPMKGAQDLVPVAARLRDLAVPFRLDIFGTGPLEDTIARAIAAQGLAGQVQLHAPVDFETELVPWLRRNADLYLCCHRQSDPSCTYVENMGCGLAVAGYGNAMWLALAEASQAGWTTPLGDTDALARQIAAIEPDRAGLAACSDRSLQFARAHDFETEFARRMDHLRRIAEAARGT
ncbi:glycosyltransferase [Roseivivax sp. CAU 1753]